MFSILAQNWRQGWQNFENKTGEALAEGDKILREKNWQGASRDSFSNVVGKFWRWEGYI